MAAKKRIKVVKVKNARPNEININTKGYEDVITLQPGQEVELNNADWHIDNLISRGYLVEV